jgi:hypothetical protein
MWRLVSRKYYDHVSENHHQHVIHSFADVSGRGTEFPDKVS